MERHAALALEEPHRVATRVEQLELRAVPVHAAQDADARCGPVRRGVHDEPGDRLAVELAAERRGEGLEPTDPFRRLRRPAGVPARDRVELGARHGLADDPAQEEQALQLLVLERPVGGHRDRRDGERPGPGEQRQDDERVVGPDRPAGARRLLDPALDRGLPPAPCRPPRAARCWVRRRRGRCSMARHGPRPHRPRPSSAPGGRTGRRAAGRTAASPTPGRGSRTAASRWTRRSSSPARASTVRSLARSRRPVRSTTRDMAMAAAPAARSRMTSTSRSGRRSRPGPRPRASRGATPRRGARPRPPGRSPA